MSADQSFKLFVADLTVAHNFVVIAFRSLFHRSKQLPTRLDSVSRLSCVHLRILMCRSSWGTHTPKQKALRKSHLNLAFCVYVMRKHSIVSIIYHSVFIRRRKKDMFFSELNVNWKNIFAFRQHTLNIQFK